MEIPTIGTVTVPGVAVSVTGGAIMLHGASTTMNGFSRGLENLFGRRQLNSEGGKGGGSNNEITFPQGEGAKAKKITTFIPKGYGQTNFLSHGQKVFYSKKTKTYISPDTDGHIKGIWKMAKSVKALGKKQTRMGTYDANLNWMDK